ncbi:MAG: glycosyltransferase [Synechococcales cyanobacterium C42_A2020_086]|nr:glycosyltransferase [Synechococcales cyanobacterium C42_A2020_086]
MITSEITPQIDPDILEANSSIHPDVTIVVVPRERFQFAQESLESLYEHTSMPFRLVYVDNNSPAKLRQYLAAQSIEKGFQLIRSQHFLSPNQARNLGLAQVQSKYVVFVDNDVIFSPGWLEALVACTEETGATVVGSLVCQYRPLHTIVHCAGGEYMPPDEYAKFIQGEPALPPETGGKWRIQEKTHFQNRKIAEVREHLKRQPTGFVEFHTMLVRREIFDQIGPLDEGFSCTKEYLDFCMLVVRAGGSVYLEPTSVVTFLTHPPAPALHWSDLPYFMVRWSDAWERDSLLHFQQKWDLVDSKYFLKRFKKLGRRRREEMIHPLVERFSFLGTTSRKWLEKRLVALEKQLNRWVSATLGGTASPSQSG